MGVLQQRRTALLPASRFLHRTTAAHVLTIARRVSCVRVIPATTSAALPQMAVIAMGFLSRVEWVSTAPMVFATHAYRIGVAQLGHHAAAEPRHVHAQTRIPAGQRLDNRQRASLVPVETGRLAALETNATVAFNARRDTVDVSLTVQESAAERPTVVARLAQQVAPLGRFAADRSAQLVEAQGRHAVAGVSVMAACNARRASADVSPAVQESVEELPTDVVQLAPRAALRGRSAAHRVAQPVEDLDRCAVAEVSVMVACNVRQASADASLTAQGNVVEPLTGVVRPVQRAVLLGRLVVVRAVLPVAAQGRCAVLGVSVTVAFNAKAGHVGPACRAGLARIGLHACPVRRTAAAPTPTDVGRRAESRPRHACVRSARKCEGSLEATAVGAAIRLRIGTTVPRQTARPV